MYLSDQRRVSLFRDQGGDTPRQADADRVSCGEQIAAPINARQAWAPSADRPDEQSEVVN
ncbi:hypothetical protein IYY11_04820 [Methylocystis sp. H62]|jgi:hypothetical protein|uniref:Uncharacterized protein n=1 Tax=Methylocystis rosea TaxID=173366 RepID=A0ABX6EM88_9HYPH|nr:MULTISPECIES: hypothetical protein [Methylocystis]MBG0792736.1 hypothetical protein [Methylocystis sp. H62]MBG0797283.1 hypothetical protein [Methylocystis sp. L43]PPD03572.1 MAG: hypothetical protein CTY36_07780 [Methylocystis sp.]QGM95938.1 hypothetical protein F7D13_17810 [Methylocystis rosea]